MIFKKSQMAFTQLVTIISVIILIFGIIGILGLEISDNDNLNNESRDYANILIEDFEDNYGTDKLAESEAVVETDTSGQGLDDFEVQYKETKASAEKKTTIITVLTKIPDTTLLIFGLEREETGFFYDWGVAVIVIVIVIGSFILLFGHGRL